MHQDLMRGSSGRFQGYSLRTLRIFQITCYYTCTNSQDSFESYVKKVEAFLGKLLHCV